MKSLIKTSILVCLLMALGTVALPVSQGRGSATSKSECIPMFTDKNPGPAVVSFELRIAESNRAADLTESTIECTDQKVYLHKEVLITNDDIADANVVASRLTGGSEVSLTLKKVGAGTLEIASTNAIGKRMAIIVNGTVISAPTIQSPLSVSVLITGRFGNKKETAQRFVAALRKR